MARRKAKEADQADRITLDGINPEQFDQLVTLLAQWIRSGEVTVHLIMPSRVRFDFNESNISDLLKKNQLPSGCISQLRTDIPFMLQGILGGQRRAIARFIANNSTPTKAKGKPKSSEQEVRAEVETRIHCVEQKLVNTDLRRQFAIKRSSKNNIYSGVYWDVVEKHDDSTGSTLPNLTNATVRIVAQKPPGREQEQFIIPFMLPGLREPVEEFVLTMTLEDLRELAKELGKAEAAIRRVMERE